MSAFADLLGPTLQTKDGAKPTADVLAGKKAVGLYFSAHWCPPCRGFTPVLAKQYTASYKALGMEIVFVSSDRDEESFDSYYKEQPWVTLPFAARDIKARLSKKYKVNGIPSFIILDGDTAETITRDGRAAVSEDPSGANFPWKPPTVWEALGEEVLDGTDGDSVSIAELREQNKYLGLYFSAHWCPPCKTFTPQLASAYKQHLKAKGLEIVFVSSDRDARSFMEYYGEMPWKAIPMGDKRKEVLSKMFDVEGIPTFVIIDAATGETITTDGRGDVGADPTGEEFPWAPKALNNMSAGKGLSSINEELSLCVLLDACTPAVADAAKAVLEPIADASKAAGRDTCFFYAPSAEGPVEQVRKLTGCPAVSGEPTIVLLDIPDNGGFYVSPAKEVTTETISALLEGHAAGALERKQLG